mgnify:CR=1 FL=1
MSEEITPVLFDAPALSEDRESQLTDPLIVSLKESIIAQDALINENKDLMNHINELSKEKQTLERSVFELKDQLLASKTRNLQKELDLEKERNAQLQRYIYELEIQLKNNAPEEDQGIKALKAKLKRYVVKNGELKRQLRQKESENQDMKALLEETYRKYSAHSQDKSSKSKQKQVSQPISLENETEMDISTKKKLKRDVSNK